ncbi:MAG: aldolase/citrate lyase family protein [Planctomycetaceae bacterium]
MIINIESVPAISALDEILAVPDLDAVLIGPHDLSCNLGVPEQYDHPDFLDACETIFGKARSVGIGAGIHFWGDVDQHVRFLDLGANLLIQRGVTGDPPQK